MKPLTAAGKLGIHLPAAPEEFRSTGITRAELDALRADPPEWLVELRRNGPFPREVMAQKLGVWPGSVTPFAALNEDTHTVRVTMDADFAAMGWIGCHPCDNTTSVHLRTSDLLALLADAGVDVELLEV